jgi:hypothetical protein
LKPEPLPSSQFSSPPFFYLFFLKGAIQFLSGRNGPRGKGLNSVRSTCQQLQCSGTCDIDSPPHCTPHLCPLRTVPTDLKLAKIRSEIEVKRGEGALKGIAVLVLSTIDW